VRTRVQHCQAQPVAVLQATVPNLRFEMSQRGTKLSNGNENTAKSKKRQGTPKGETFS